MKKFIICALTALLTATVVLGVEISKVAKVSSTVSDKLSSYGAAVDSFKDLTENDGVYTVKKYKEKIGVFKRGDALPEIVLDIFVFSLPERDRLMLEVGYCINAENLYSVIEDYTG